MTRHGQHLGSPFRLEPNLLHFAADGAVNELKTVVNIRYAIWNS